MQRPLLKLTRDQSWTRRNLCSLLLAGVEEFLVELKKSQLWWKIPLLSIPGRGLCIQVCEIAAVGRYHTASKPKEGQDYHTDRWLKDICLRRIFMMMKWEFYRSLYTVIQNLFVELTLLEFDIQGLRVSLLISRSFRSLIHSHSGPLLNWLFWSLIYRDSVSLSLCSSLGPSRVWYTVTQDLCWIDSSGVWCTGTQSLVADL